MRRWGFGLALLGMAVTAHAAAPGGSDFFRDSDLPAIQLAQFNTHRLTRTTAYRLTLNIAPVHAAGAMPIGAGPGGIPGLLPVAEPQIARASRSHMTRFFDGGSPAILPLLRLESKGERFEIKPRRHALSIQWSKALP
ncbi:MAG: hypothetical protein HY066_14795 [Betaproteobacteria bacterium]|nr:hypothetical protein [Betaproteobacteria bacterium]